MNHWVSRYQDDKEICSACGEKIPNSSEKGGVQITGDCSGCPRRAPEDLIVCSRCVQVAPFHGKYKLVDLPLPHAGFCQQCRTFVGDGYYLVDVDPPKLAVSLTQKTRGDLWGIWCTHPTLPPRWVPHEDPLIEMPKPFGSEEDAVAYMQEHASVDDTPLRPPGTFGWTFTPKRLREDKS